MKMGGVRLKPRGHLVMTGAIPMRRGSGEDRKTGGPTEETQKKSGSLKMNCRIFLVDESFFTGNYRSSG
jgi:hypothetical protein